MMPVLCETGPRVSIGIFVILIMINILGASHYIKGKVHVECGSKSENEAYVTYFGEALSVLAYTANGSVCNFEQNIGTATWAATFTYMGDGSSNCVFEKMSHEDVYSVKVYSRMVYPMFESQDDETFLVECNFQPISKDIDDQVDVADSLNPPEIVIDAHKAPRTRSRFSIEIVQPNGQVVKHVQLGQIVHLRAKIFRAPEDHDKDFTPTDCHVLTPSGQEHSPILTQGCGLGFPFKLNDGFLMSQNVAYSPMFHMFRLDRHKGVVFRCHFLVCNGKCKGSSCVRNKKSGISNARLLQTTPPVRPEKLEMDDDRSRRSHMEDEATNRHVQHTVAALASPITVIDPAELIQVHPNRPFFYNDYSGDRVLVKQSDFPDHLKIIPKIMGKGSETTTHKELDLNIHFDLPSDDISTEKPTTPSTAVTLPLDNVSQSIMVSTIIGTIVVVACLMLMIFIVSVIYVLKKARHSTETTTPSSA